jgi:hypothetical protein
MEMLLPWTGPQVNRLHNRRIFAAILTHRTQTDGNLAQRQLFFRLLSTPRQSTIEKWRHPASGIMLEE